MSVSELFHLFVASHIVTGATGLLAFWVPVFAKKGGTAHRTVGKVFTVTMLLTGTAAIGISLCTLADPVSTHPHLTEHADFRDPALVRAIFGWMMLALATLTLNLAWYGWQCIRNRRDHTANRESVNLGLQAATFITATNCAVQGLLIGQPLMLGVSLIGWATVGTNLWFLYKRQPAANDWLREHIKALVGAGISVYTAFFAFGAVRTFPTLALHPVLWAIPLTVGLAIILYQWRKLARPRAALPAGQRA
ncbi:putative membrane protein [Methyloversatilis sp. RAC08]|uniref:hypothetical protein n=1 Tax=Methyloversatilis sp. RAC08 TaxID=1842540 RepID=UPI00083D724E|nr:hypothetical protein [Methyloversatilis sp. RAC08]AOF82195.1 putative membrane protein [Methyloversatilis sp. RAC08]